MKTRALRLMILPAVFGAALTGCGTARRQAPEMGATNWVQAAANPRAASLVTRGQYVFYTHCFRCHPGGAGGLGPALNEKPLPEPAIRFQVRHGLGAMPAFPESALSKDDLEAVIVYLKTLRRQPAEDQAAH